MENEGLPAGTSVTTSRRRSGGRGGGSTVGDDGALQSETEPPSERAGLSSTADRPISVLLLEDQRMCSDGFARLAGEEPDIEMVAAFASAEEGLDQLVEMAPDVAVISLGLTGMSGVESIRRARAGARRTHVVAVGSQVSPADVIAAFEAGAMAFVPRSHAAADLMHAIRAAARGEVVIPGEYVASVMMTLASRRAREDETQSRDWNLTPRERDVLQQLIVGRSVRDIARGLGISVHTLRGHIRGILSKGGVHSIAQAVAAAVRDGFGDAPSGVGTVGKPR